MNKIIAREVNPAEVDFSFYFDNDGMTSKGGEYYAVYITGNSNDYGFNLDEYNKIVEQADRIIDGFEDVKSGYCYKTFKEVMQENDIAYTSHKCHLLKEWAKTADTDDADSIAEFLTITTSEEWNSRAFCGYSQGDYCKVVYCTRHYSEEAITPIGEFWLGCGTEFCIDDCYGYFVVDDIRWKEGEALKAALAKMYGCKPEELEVYLYDGEHTVTNYKLMEVSA